ncbi:MAG: serine/threonine protein kinase, partial [Planctomycetales bacterium]
MSDSHQAPERRDTVEPAVSEQSGIAENRIGNDDETLGPETSLSEIPPSDGSFPRRFGEYELLEEIDRGGMGVVFKARQVNLNRVVALKMIRAGELADDNDLHRFYAEAEAAASLQHPGIVPVYEVGHWEGRHYFSMAFVQGRNLASVSRAFSSREAAALVRQIAEAIAFAHDRGVIHRDLKPANVLLDENGRPLVADFGLAKKIGQDSELTGTGQILGTPAYMAPEQAAGRTDEVGVRSDVYGLGTILYHLLTGRPPFQSDDLLDLLTQVREREPTPPRKLDRGISRDVENICLKCLQKEPARRYASAGDLAEDLARFLGHKPIRARPASPVVKLLRWCRRNPVVACLTALSAFSLLMTLFVLWSSLARMEEMAWNNQRLLTESLAMRLDERINSNAQAVSILSRESEVRDLLAAAEQDRARLAPAVQATLENVLDANEYFSSAFVLAKTGEALVSTNPAHPGR